MVAYVTDTRFPGESDIFQALEIIGSGISKPWNKSRADPVLRGA
jgi:hypothetical protein